jgi:hypothetical protein
MNVPFSQTPYLFAALLVSAVVHEFGHALAAAASASATALTIA